MQSAVAAFPEKTFQTPALTAAQKKAEKFLRDARRFGPVAITPKIQAMLRRENHSVQKLFAWVVTMAFHRPTDYRRPKRGGGFEVVMVNRPGGRRWAQRDLAAVAAMSVNTAVRALKRLRELGLIKWKAWLETGTYIFVKNFSRYVDPRAWRAALNHGEIASKNSVSVTDTLSCPPDHFSQILTSDHVPSPKKEGDTLENSDVVRASKRMIEAIFAKKPEWLIKFESKR